MTTRRCLVMVLLMALPAHADLPDCSGEKSHVCFINCADVQTDPELLYCPRTPGTVLPEGYDYLTCPTGGTRFDLRVCADKEFSKADRALNAAYAAALRRVRHYDLTLSPGVRSGESYLREAQRAWIVFRDADAEAYASRYDGGSIQPMMHLSHLLGLTQTRTEQLLGIAEESFA